MTGPQHYQMAEDLIAAVMDKNRDIPLEGMNTLMAAAQIHATLALAAAAALAGNPDMRISDYDEWVTAAGVQHQEWLQRKMQS